MSFVDTTSADIFPSELGFSTTPAVAPEVVKDLEDFYHSLSNPFEKGFHPTLQWKDTSLKKAVSHKICSALQPYIEEWMPGYQPLYGSFMVKEPGEESAMKLHQDWSYVEEKEHVSFAIWLPLQDLNAQNGALHVIPKSHLFENTVRGPGVFCPFSEHAAYLTSHFGQPLYLKKGAPVIWNHRLLHYSPANLSQFPRIAVTAIIVPKGVHVIHYFKPEENDMVQQFEVEQDFFFHYNIGHVPTSKVKPIKTFEHRMPSYSKTQLKEILGQKKSWWKQILRLNNIT